MSFKRATDIVRDIIQEQLAELKYEDRVEDGTTVTAYLVQLKTSARFYKVSTKTEFEELWSKIRMSPVLHDFVVGGASKLYLRYSGEPELNGDLTTAQVWKALMGLFASAMAVCNPRESATCTDAEYQKNGFSEEQFADYFHANPWLFFLVIATQLAFTDYAIIEV